ncbi:hypothetical protein L6452_07969 [Arctium lappa]|uniref:Uncharacterized protein n=1 Tax=Arctium lappa TaxID=4217 RepID=A0ACB9DFY0_ARCLA|nr:hypothetical protein L6452_07969 [Arctium lappa]
MEEQIDWDDLFDDTFFDPSSILPTSSSDHGDNHFPLSIHDVEQLLLKDNDEIPTGDDAFNSAQETADGFFHDILLDSPLDGEKSGEVVDASDGDNSIDEHKNKAVDDQKSEAVDDHKEEKKNSDDDPNDPLAKKRKRQLRNKDAALKSRERKKMYVKDLEMKSRYYEGECRRLGSLLQCFMAENQALRFSLHSNKAYNASMTKQESAVLFLESLLLGSLLWLIGNVCQLVLHQPSRLLQVVGEEVPSPNLVLVARKVGSKMCRKSSLLVGKGYKSSRSRMRRPINMIGVVF